MLNRRSGTLICGAIVLAWWWGGTSDEVPRPPGGAHPVGGSFDALTYNVAGLPAGISASSPDEFSPQIGARLHPYDLVLLQEDFCYHDLLVAATSHPFRSRGGPAAFGTLVGDGLSRLSRLWFEAPQRVRWARSSGILTGYCDALAAKGFNRAAVEVSPGVRIDVYNLHADAGEGDGDRAARRIAFAQLADYLATHSAGRAVIVGGDFNARWSDPADRVLLLHLLARTELRDAARFLGIHDDHVDRFLFRPAPYLALAPVHWSAASEFVAEDGRPLSDHPAIHVRFAWRVRGQPGAQDELDRARGDAGTAEVLSMISP